MRPVDAVLFDKTVTLTKGTPAVTAVEVRAADEAGTTHAAGTSARAPRSKDRLLTLAAAAESDSEHPLAKAIVAAARDQIGRASCRERVTDCARVEGTHI